MLIDPRQARRSSEAISKCCRRSILATPSDSAPKQRPLRHYRILPTAYQERRLSHRRADRDRQTPTTEIQERRRRRELIAHDSDIRLSPIWSPCALSPGCRGLSPTSHLTHPRRFSQLHEQSQSGGSTAAGGSIITLHWDSHRVLHGETFRRQTANPPSAEDPVGV